VSHKKNFILFLVLWMPVLLGCETTSDAPSVADMGSSVTETDAMSAVDAEIFQLVPSSRPRLKFKGAERYGNDLIDSLFLSEETLCNELGKYPCLDVHKIVLGGVEPYRAGINKPLERASATAPIAVDRVALSACVTRAEQDFTEGSDALFFDAFPEALGAPSPTWLSDVVHRLYRRILRRSPDQSELDTLVAFHSEVVSEYPGDGREALKQWQVLSCFMLATSLEALFY